MPSQTPQQLFNRLQKAYNMGENDKKNGRHRVSPFYEDPMADQYWFAGYDGVPIGEVGKIEPKKSE